MDTSAESSGLKEKKAVTTEELLTKVESRLNKTDNPSLPPEETMAAILELGNEREEAIKERLSMSEKIGSLESRIQGAIEEKEEAYINAKNAYDKAKEQEWLAHELANFIKDVANGIYEGKERAAANRVYDLNGNSIKKKRLKAYTFDSLDEAKKVYAEEVNKPYDAEEFLEWLFRFA